jgi:hypothetical protein
MSLSSPNNDPSRVNPTEISSKVLELTKGWRIAFHLCEDLLSENPFKLLLAEQTIQTLLRDKSLFVDALPALLHLIPDLREWARSAVVTLIANRPHWISTEHLNQRLIPLVLREGFMDFDGPTVVSPLVHVVGINAFRVHAHHIPSIFEAVWRRIDDDRGPSSEGVLLAPFGQRTPPQFLGHTANAMSSVIEKLCVRLNNKNFFQHSRRDTVEDPLIKEDLATVDCAIAGLFAHRKFFQGKLPCPNAAKTEYGALLTELRVFVESATDRFVNQTSPLRIEFVLPLLSYPRLDLAMPGYNADGLERLCRHFAESETYGYLAEQIEASLNTTPQPEDARFPDIIPGRYEANALVTANMIETRVHAWENGQMPRGGQALAKVTQRLQQIGSSTLRAPIFCRAGEGFATIVGY